MLEHRWGKKLQRKFAALTIALMVVCTALFSHADSGPALAFPGAVGWAADTVGGRGGKIIRVTNLNADGPGSLASALATKGPRIIVFEVGGVIDLHRSTLRLTEPFATIAGQTAPSPGITLIRGGIDIATHDIVLRHLRIRPGSAGAEKGRWGEDAVSVVAGYNVIVDHCSLSWATDENLSASGPRFNGKTPEAWRAATSHKITFSHNIIAEGLAHATHPKGEHSKGSLLHDNTSDILLYGNLYAHNFERNPHLKGGVRAMLVNNVIYDPGQRAVHYNLMPLEWEGMPFQNGQLTAVGNVMRSGPSTRDPIAFLMLGGNGDLQVFTKDNKAVDRIGNALPLRGRYGVTPARFIESETPPLWLEHLPILPSEQVEAWVFANAGARPWDRDHHDVRIISDSGEGRGRIIDDQEQVGGYPKMPESHRRFDPSLWDLDTMEALDDATLDRPLKKLGT